MFQLQDTITNCKINYNKEILTFLLRAVAKTQFLPSVLGEDDSYLYLVLVTACRSVGKIKSSEISCITSTVFVALGNHGEVGISEVRKLLNSGSFYFTVTVNDCDPPLDLSLTYQRQCLTQEPDNRFFW